MDVSGSLHTLRRHWVLTTLLVLLTLLMAEAAWVKIPGPYQSQSQVALLASQQASQPNGNNPYLTFDGSLVTTADIVRREVLDPRIVTALAARGFTDSYEVQNDPLGIGPVLDIIVTGSSKASVEATQSAVTAEVQTELQQLQQGILPKNQITSMVVSSNPHASLLVSKKARPLVAVLAFGLILTLAIPQIVDAATSRRRNRRQKTQRPRPRAATGASGLSPGDLSKPAPFPATAGQRTETTGTAGAEAVDGREVASTGAEVYGGSTPR